MDDRTNMAREIASLRRVVLTLDSMVKHREDEIERLEKEVEYLTNESGPTDTVFAIIVAFACCLALVIVAYEHRPQDEHVVDAVPSTKHPILQSIDIVWDEEETLASTPFCP